MPYFDFVWNDKIADHLDQHGISQEDFEQVVSHPVSRDESDSSGRPVAFGYTDDGRYIIAVYEMLDR